MTIPTWSFSGLKTFKTCPKKFFHLKVVKDTVEPEGEMAIYGKVAHEAAELYIRDGTPLGPRFTFMQGTLDNLKAIKGDKYCEYEMGLSYDLQPREFTDPTAWYRGICDLLIVNEDAGTARIIDYKFGKSRYADTGQLELMALATFKYFPKVKHIKAGLLFVHEDKFVQAIYKAELQEQYWAKWRNDIALLQAAHDSGVWNPKPSGLCKQWCYVTSCEYCGRR
jgi:PD-(D/E)XK nuclease superfamily